MSSTSESIHLSPKQSAAFEALLGGGSVTEAARAAGVHRSTLHEWLRTDATLRDALTQARQMHADRILDAFQELTAGAIQTLREALTSPEAPIAIRLRAALAILKVCTTAAAPVRPAEKMNFAKRTQQVIENNTSGNLTEPGRSTQSVQSGATKPDTLDTETGDDDAADTAADAPATHASRPQPDAGRPISRSAPCPCGSRQKYKRCCGRNAPPVLSTHGAASAVA